MTPASCVLVTGASSGVGAAVAKELAATGTRLWLTARDSGRLGETERECAAKGARVTVMSGDLTDDAVLADLADEVLRSTSRLDVLVHAAGAYSFEPFASLPLEEFTHTMRLNLRAPFHLTQRLLPALIAAQGQVVFVNSSAADRDASRGQPRTAAYTASKHALRGLADVLRAEVNGAGVRVLSVYLGRTATPMQQRVAWAEGTPYRPEELLQPADVARSIHDTLRLPRTAEVTELRLRPMGPGTVAAAPASPSPRTATERS